MVLPFDGTAARPLLKNYAISLVLPRGHTIIYRYEFRCRQGFPSYRQLDCRVCRCKTVSPNNARPALRGQVATVNGGTALRTEKTSLNPSIRPYIYRVFTSKKQLLFQFHSLTVTSERSALNGARERIITYAFVDA